MRFNRPNFRLFQRVLRNECAYRPLLSMYYMVQVFTTLTVWRKKLQEEIVLWFNAFVLRTELKRFGIW